MIYTQLHLDLAKVRLQTHHQEARNACLVRSLPADHSPSRLTRLLTALHSWHLAAQAPAARSLRG